MLLNDAHRRILFHSRSKAAAIEKGVLHARNILHSSTVIPESHEARSIRTRCQGML